MAKNTTAMRAGRDSDQFRIRLPDKMRMALSKLAARHARSMNSEIVHALTLYLNEHQDAAPGQRVYQSPAEIKAAFNDFEARLDQKFAELSEKLGTEKIGADEIIRRLEKKMK